MAEENKDQNAQLAQTLFNKGFATFERGNLDIAIDLLLRAVELSPSFFRARRFLRAAELQKLRKGAPPSVLKDKLSELCCLPRYIKVSTLYKAGKIEQALFEAEKLLKINPVQRRAVYLYADIAEAAGLMDAAILTLEAVSEYDPQDMDIEKRLGGSYMKAEDYGKARDCYSKVLAARPLAADVLKLLKDAEAHYSMKSGGWDSGEDPQGSSFTARIDDAEQARKLDIQAKAQVVGSDADIMINEWRAKIVAEPGNLNYYRALARTFLQLKRYAEAIETLQQARKLVSADPEIDRSLSEARVKEYGARIEALRAANDAAGVARLEQEKTQFMFDDLVARVKNYPNDLRLRYELGVIYYQKGLFEEAIQQLQLAQRSPKERTDALYYLARSFRAKGQDDIALMQFETALELLPIMDDNRKKVLFDLGEVYEATGNHEKAFVCYREVYGADIGYLDISQKMERIFKQRQQDKKN
ncbi:MAG: tetratricopeptide repeat protein [Kiritimatiellia bacterium]